MSSQEEFTIRFKCPKCGENIVAKLKRSELDFKGGIASASLLHGSPPHVVIVYVDINGEVRGVEVPEVTLQVGAPTPTRPEPETIEISGLEEIDASIVRETIEREFLEKVLVYVIADRPTYFIFQTIDENYFRALEELAKLLDNETQVLRDTIADTRALVAISSSFYLKNEKAITKDCALYTLTKKIKCSSPRSKVFQKMVKQYILSKGRERELSTIIRYYIGLTDLAYDILKRYRKLKRKELGRLANIPSKDLDAVIDCLIAKGAGIEKDTIYLTRV